MMQNSERRHRAREKKRATPLRRALRFESLEMRNLLTTFNLGQARVTIFGADVDDESGVAVRGVGDVNGDGFDDALIGARYGDAAGNTKNAAGDSYLIFGKATWGNDEEIDLGNLGTAGVTLFGADVFDYSGRAVSGAGDVNGDGFDDFLIGAVEADASGNMKNASGETYLIFGKADWSGTPTLNLANLGTAGVTIFGADPFDYSGRSVSGGGDINGDGFDDLILGAHYGDAASNLKLGAGETAIVFGKSDWSGTPTLDLANLGAAGVTMFGTNPGDGSGLAVSHGGDINGDGFDDLLIGARYADAAENAKNSAGESYVVFGKASWVETLTLDLANLGTAGITLFGADVEDYSGVSLSRAGDVNGDGFDDFLIGAVGGDGSNSDAEFAGETYLVFGKANWGNHLVDLAALGNGGVKFFGAEANDISGLEVSAAGDVNGDGFDDVLIGASLGDATQNQREDAGETYLLFGEEDWPQTIQLANAGTLGLRFFGADPFDHSGYSISSAGDLDGDGFDDLIIGAPNADGKLNQKEDAGESYFVFGGDQYTSSVTRLGSPNNDTLTGTTRDDVIVGHRGNDTLVGLGGEDVLRGGQGDDVLAVSDLNFRRIVGGSGFDTLRLDGSNLTLNLTTIPNNRIVSIEQINLRGSGPNTLVLNHREVLNLSERTNTLVVLRDANDTVDRGAGWTQQANESIGGIPFEVFTQGAAVLKIQSTIADVSLASVPSVGSVLAGNSLFYTVTASNAGPAAATGVVVTNSLPAGLTFDAANSTNLCAAIGPNVTCDLGTVAAAANKVVQIGVKVASSVPHGTELSSTVNLVHNEQDPTPDDHTATATVTVNRQTEVSILQTASTQNPVAGAALVYSVKIDNDGPSDASGVIVTDTLPVGVTFFAATSSPECTAEGQVVTCNVGVVTAGTSVTKQIATRLASSLAAGTVLENTTELALQETDPTTDDHTSTTSVVSTRQANVSVVKTASANPVIAGGAFHYTIEIHNGGPSDATGVSVDDLLAPELTYDPANSSSTCLAAGQFITCDIGTLIAGSSATQTIAVTVAGDTPRGTVISNTAEVTVTETDPNQGDQSSTVSVTVNVDPDPLPWQNVKNRRDVNDDSFVTPIDALQIINELNDRKFSGPNGALFLPPPPPPHPFYDVTGDNFVVPQDALQVINFLNGGGGGEGEGTDAAREGADVATILPPDASVTSTKWQLNRLDRGRRDDVTIRRPAAPLMALPAAAQGDMDETLDDLAEELARLWSRSGQEVDELLKALA